jgi:hypothetical protein
MAGRKSPPLLDRRFEILFPSILPEAIEIAAARRLVSSAEYIRQSIIDRLRADGIDLLAMIDTAAETKTSLAA